MTLIYTLPDGRQLTQGQAFELNGIQYGRRWLERASPDSLAALGIVVTQVVPEPEPPAPNPVPEVVSMFQCRAVLMIHGLFDTVDAAMKAAGGINEQAWEYATEVRRDSPLVLAMAQQLNLTDEQVDQLFIEAAQITI